MHARAQAQITPRSADGKFVASEGPVVATASAIITTSALPAALVKVRARGRGAHVPASAARSQGGCCADRLPAHHCACPRPPAQAPSTTSPYLPPPKVRGSVAGGCASDVCVRTQTCVPEQTHQPPP